MGSFSIGFNENIIYYVTSKMIPIKMYVGGEQKIISYNIMTSTSWPNKYTYQPT